MSICRNRHCRSQFLLVYTVMRQWLGLTRPLPTTLWKELNNPCWILCWVHKGELGSCRRSLSAKDGILSRRCNGGRFGIGSCLLWWASTRWRRWRAHSRTTWQVDQGTLKRTVFIIARSAARQMIFPRLEAFLFRYIPSISLRSFCVSDYLFRLGV